MDSQFNGLKINELDTKKSYYYYPNKKCSGFTLLMKYVLLYKRYGNSILQYIRAYIKKYDCDRRNHQGYTALAIAIMNSCTYSNIKIVKLLLQKRTRHDIIYWGVPLISAVNAYHEYKSCDIQTVLMLFNIDRLSTYVIKHMVEENMKGKFLRTVLTKGPITLRKYIREQCCFSIYRLKSLLMTACSNNNYGMIKVLVNFGAQINETDRENNSAAYYLPNDYNLKIAKILIKRGVNLYHHNNDNVLCLEYIMKKNRLSPALLETITRFGYLKKQDSDGNSILMLFIKLREWKIVKKIIVENKFNIVKKKSNNKDTVLHKLANIKYYESKITPLIKMLIDYDIELDSSNSQIVTPLMLFIKNDQYKNAKLLIEHGCDVNKTDDYEQTILHYLGEKTQTHMDIVKYLVNKNMNIDLQDKYGRTPLMLFMGNEKYDIVRYLINQGCNVNKQDNDGQSIINYMYNSNDTDLLKLLIDKGVNINNKDKYGKTLLVKCIESKNFKYLKILMKHNVDLTTKQPASMMLQLIHNHNNKENRMRYRIYKNMLMFNYTQTLRHRHYYKIIHCNINSQYFEYMVDYMMIDISKFIEKFRFKNLTLFRICIINIKRDRKIVTKKELRKTNRDVRKYFRLENTCEP